MGMFEGALTALVTPFSKDAVDERALRDLVEHQIESGIHGLVPAGTTGESVSLSHAEVSLVFKTVVGQARGRVPVIAGVGSASTRHSLELAQIAKDAGADGLLVVSPYYNRPSQEGLYRHFTTIAAASSLPIVLYNIPGRCCVDLSLDLLARLAEIPSIVAIKEATGNVVRSADILAKLGDRFTVLSGDDGITLPILALGGRGVISVASNVTPAAEARLCELVREGDFEQARAVAEKQRPLYEVLFAEPNPGPVKAALALLGRIQPEIRLPMVMPTQATQDRIRGVLGALGVSGAA